MKNVLITGGSSGIGLEIAERLAIQNYNLILISNNPKRIKQAEIKIKKINKNIICKTYLCDLSNIIKTKKVFNKIKKNIKVDIIINNFGGTLKNNNNKKELVDFDELNYVINKNLYCSYLAIQYFINDMIKSNWGRIITISSAVNQKFNSEVSYNVAKISQLSLMKNLSTKPTFLKKNITFNCVSPGAIMTKNSKWTKMKNKNIKLFKRVVKKQFPMGIGETSDVANIVSFLCESSSKYINGTNIIVDGGRSNFQSSEM